MALSDTHNYWEYAEKILPAAQAGDPDAEFYLSKVLESCDEDNRMYFQKRGQKLSLDEGLQYAVARHLSMENAQSVYQKCHDFQDKDPTRFGTSAEWLQKATEAGQPIGEATTALKALVENQKRNFAKAAGAPGGAQAQQIEPLADPRALLRAALESKDPEVLFRIGEAQGLLNPSSTDTNVSRFAWQLVACQRGFDCSAQADWVKNTCGDDAECLSAVSPGERVRKLAGDGWPDVQRRAEEISAKLDAGQWDDLGLGP